MEIQIFSGSAHDVDLSVVDLLNSTLAKALETSRSPRTIRAKIAAALVENNIATKIEAQEIARDFFRDFVTIK